MYMIQKTLTLVENGSMFNQLGISINKTTSSSVASQTSAGLVIIAFSFIIVIIITLMSLLVGGMNNVFWKYRE